tara:strand:+ start:1573 stop:1917 length:345 start_codon:yes stop_codon:yes gene_type:complete
MDSLEEKLKQWIQIDQLIQNKNSEIKELKSAKTNVNTELFTIIENNNLQNSTFKINDNYIKYSTTKQTSPITLKYLESCLNELIEDESKIEQIMNYIKNNRQTKIVNEIKNNKK